MISEFEIHELVEAHAQHLPCHRVKLSDCSTCSVLASYRMTIQPMTVPMNHKC